jgi:hypothetical protein
MPIRKLHLSRLEQEEHLFCLQQLQAEGHDVEIAEKERPKKVDTLDIEVSPPLENMVFDVRNGRVVYYAVRLRMVAKRSGVVLTSCEIVTDWDDQILLLNIDEGNPLCKLGWFDVERTVVLNSRLENHLRFHDRGEMVEGWILASGLEPIPQQYRNNAIVPCQLTFRDQFHDEIEVRAYLSVLRSRKAEIASGVRRSGPSAPAPTVNLSVRNLDGRRRSRS